jgi:phosphoglycerate kinase
MNKKTIKDINLKGKRVLVRVDYNVSIDDGFKVTDDYRIRQTLPTIDYLVNQGCTVFLLSHFGRPEGKRQEKYSLEPVYKYLKKIYPGKVSFFKKNYLSKESQKQLKKKKTGSVTLLENIRFYPQEKENDQAFAKQLAQLADVYINDAFGVSHRHQASVIAITHVLPSVAGFLLEKEVDIIRNAIEKPKHPLVAIIGGAKVGTKVNLIGKLLEKADYCLIGGKTANIFLKAWGYKVGKTKIKYELVEQAKHLFWKASRSNTAMLLPTDAVLGDLENNKINGVSLIEKIPAQWEPLDIGPKTQAEFGNVIAKAGTIIWNGPMGVFEKKEFANGTDFIYYAIAQNQTSTSIVGGGDTLAALKKKEYLKVIDHVSTGGGAMLQFIETRTLPGIEALQDK